MDYIYADDGKLHLRYSDLVRCTPNQVNRLVREKAGLIDRYESDHMVWGSERHEMWKEESIMTKFVPVCFGELDNGKYLIPVDYIEKEFTTEIARDVVIHSRPDSINIEQGVINDYKTIIDGSDGFQAKLGQYKQSKQGKWYAYQLAIHNIQIKTIRYLLEAWNNERTEIIGYHCIEMPISMLDIAGMKDWALNRVAIYKAELDIVTLNN